MRYGRLQIYVKMSQKRVTIIYNLSLWTELELEHLCLVFSYILKTKLMLASQNLLMYILAGHRSKVRSDT